MVEHLKKLKAGESIECPVYDFTKHTRSSQVLRIDPKPVILVEGILLLADPRVRELLDIKVYVEPTRAKADVVINSGKNDIAFDLFVSKISQILGKMKQEGLS